MTKRVPILAMAALALLASGASAQSQVTIFGIADVAATRIKNGSAGTRTVLASGQANTSRLGFRGVEDLGGGLKAAFWVEGQLDIDDGGGGDAFTFERRTTVSLIGPFGELRAGRDYVPTFLNWNSYDLWGYVGVATTANLRGSFLSLGGARTGVRASNTLSYRTPALGGFYGQLMAAAGEGATGNKFVGGRAGYDKGGLEVSVAFGKTYKTGDMVDDLEVRSIGVSYDFGPVYLVAAYEKAEYSTRDRELATVGARIPAGPGRVKVQLAKASGTGPSSRPRQYDGKLIGVGYEHSLSKRTTLYVNYGSIDNGGTSSSGGSYTATSNGPSGIGRGETSTGYQAGVRHTF